jgi:hypothetical protein
VGAAQAFDVIAEFVDGQGPQVRLGILEVFFFSDTILVIVFPVGVAVQISEFGHGVFFCE